jgi:hypothetical protein
MTLGAEMDARMILLMRVLIPCASVYVMSINARLLGAQMSREKGQLQHLQAGVQVEPPFPHAMLYVDSCFFSNHQPPKYTRICTY